MKGHRVQLSIEEGKGQLIENRSVLDISALHRISERNVYVGSLSFCFQSERLQSMVRSIGCVVLRRTEHHRQTQKSRAIHLTSDRKQR